MNKKQQTRAGKKSRQEFGDNLRVCVLPKALLKLSLFIFPGLKKFLKKVKHEVFFHAPVDKYIVEIFKIQTPWDIFILWNFLYSSFHTGCPEIYSETLDGMDLILTLLENKLPCRSFVKIWPRFHKGLFLSLMPGSRLWMNL